ncbi:MAG: sigma-70 family RNA polymerase sigma factor [Ruminiclostridium sp.]|nr:sigma-70 family RNA polymerase sigma factor [Ruminiclostridium sp.]
MYKTCYMQVYSYMMTLCKNSEQAEEITQKAFYKAFLNFKKYRGDASELTWLCAIAKNIYLDMLRREKKRDNMPENIPENISDGEDIARKAEDKESVLRIHRILHQMEEPYKEVFQLRVFGELSFGQIGQLFGKSENWARVTYYRAKNKIRDKLEEGGNT